MTSQINKKEEARLTNEINDLKRAASVARPYIEIQSDLNKVEDQLKIHYGALNPVKDELNFKYNELN